MARCFSYITALVAAVFVLCSYTVQQVPNPKNAYEDGFVANPDGILRQDVVTQINQIAFSLRKNADVELAVVAIKRMEGTYDEFEFSQKLFNYWGIGGTKNQGVLVFLETTERAVRIHTGGGLEGVLTDADCEDIVYDVMIPALRQDYSHGILLGVQALEKHLTNPEVLAELLLDNYKPKKTQSVLFDYLMLCVVFCWGLFIVGQKELLWNEGGSNNVRYNHARTLECVFWCVSVLFPLPVFFLALWFRGARRGLRRRPVVCMVCGKKMKLLSESDEDEFLTSGQQSEETVGSVDYDVWHCECGNNIILPYVKQQTKYTHCPSCTSKTFYTQSDVVLKAATQLRTGLGEKTQVCRHCGYRTTEKYIIPKLPIVVATGGGRSGGGRGGGSWGGGISFGGGAGGRF